MTSMNEKAKVSIEEYIDFIKTNNNPKDISQIEIYNFIWAKIIKDWAKEQIIQNKKSIWIKSYVGEIRKYSRPQITFTDNGITNWFGAFASDTEYVRFMDYGKTWSFDKDDLENGKNN